MIEKKVPHNAHVATAETPTTLERAFVLARSGSFQSMTSLKEQLRFEGFRVDQLQSRLLRKQLALLMASAKPGSACATLRRLVQKRELIRSGGPSLRSRIVGRPKGTI